MTTENEDKPKEYEAVLVVRGLGPQTQDAVQSWAPELAYQEYPYAIVVASGNQKMTDEFRVKLIEVSNYYDVPVYLFDQPIREVFYANIGKVLQAQTEALKMAKLIEDKRAKSYGAGTNEGLLWAKVLGAKRVFYFDDDTRPIPELDILQKHLDLLGLRGAVAVTGGYCGAHWLDVSFLPKRSQQDRLAGFLMSQIPSGKPVQDSVPFGMPPQEGRCRWLIGGNNLLSEEFYNRLCCPILNDAVSTDDILLGVIGSKVFENRVWKSDLPVIHAQAIGRKAPAKVQEYLQKWARTIAFWAMLKDDPKDDPKGWMKFIVSTAKGEKVLTQPNEEDLDANEGKDAVNNFGYQLKQIVGLAGKSVARELGHISAVADQMMQGQGTVLGENVVETAKQGIIEYQKLLEVWPAIWNAIDDETKLATLDAIKVQNKSAIERQKQLAASA